MRVLTIFFPQIIIIAKENYMAYFENNTCGSYKHSALISIRSIEQIYYSIHINI